MRAKRKALVSALVEATHMLSAVQAYRACDANDRERLLAAARERAQAAEKEAERLRAELATSEDMAEVEGEAAEGAVQDGLMTAAELGKRVQQQAGYIAEYQGVVERLRRGVRVALDALKSMDYPPPFLQEAVNALNKALEDPGTEGILHGAGLADALEMCRERKHEIEELVRTCADLRKARDGHEAAAMRSAERMAAAADVLQAIDLVEADGKVARPVCNALGLLTGAADPRPWSEAERREYARTASQRNDQRMRELQGLDTFPKVVVGGEEV